jgi:polyphenol oxidase
MNDFSFHDLPNGWTVGRFASLERMPAIRHLVTTRRALDVDLIRADRPTAAKALAEAMGLRGVAWLEQVHGDAILDVATDRLAGPEHSRGAGGSTWLAAGKGDGLVTATPGLGLMCVSADCPLVLVADMDGRAVGVAHASWRGTVKRITLKLVRRMAERYGLDPSRLVGCICPSAGPERYEVGPEVVEAALAGIGPEARRYFHPQTESCTMDPTGAIGPDCEGKVPSPRKGETRTGKLPSPREGKALFDLWAANRDQLLAAGLREENVHVAGVCTITRNDLFPSHRVEGQSAGRFAAVIAIGL